MKELRRIHREDLRNLCVRENWYNTGSNEQYVKLLQKAECCNNIETSTLVNIAEDILAHSDTEHDLSSVCFAISEICRSYFTA